MNKSRFLTIYAVLALFLSSTNLFAQILFLEAAFPGQPTSGYIAPIGTGKLDFTGDSVPDLVFIPSDFPVLIIQDGYHPTNSFSIDHGPMLAGLGVMGFHEFDGSNSFKEIVLAEKKGKSYINPVVLDINGAVLWDGSGKVLLTISNMERDVCDEDAEGPCPDAIVVGNPAVPQVEIWREKKN